MKEPEDEAFEDLAKRQGDWGLQGSRKLQILRYAESKGTSMNKFSTWEDVPINELNREKLIEALEWCGVEIMRLRKERDRWASAGNALEYLKQGGKND